MKLRSTLFIFLIAFSLGVPAFDAVSSNSETVYLGTGKSDITPPLGTPLAGFGRRRGKPSVGVHDQLHARALALQRGDDLVVFVSADLVLIDEELRQAVVKKIKEVKSIREDQLILFATHTHSGSGAIGGRFWERFIMGKFRKEAFEKVTRGIADAAVQAMKTDIPVKVEYGEALIEELIENRLNDKIHVPDKLKVLKFTRFEGETAGLLIFMAAHPTIFSAGNFLFSADYPGTLSQILEEQNQGAVAVFVNGAAGDLRPHTAQFEQPKERSEAYGFTVAKKISGLPFQEIRLDGVWKSSLIKTRLPRTQVRLGWFKVPSLIGNRVFPRKSYFQAVRLGRLLFLTFPGEVGSETGFEIERRAQTQLFIPLIVGYANDYIGYVIPRRFYQDRHQYESRASFYGPKMDWFIQKQADDLTDKLLTSEEKEIIRKPGKVTHRAGLPVFSAAGDPYHLGFEEGRLLKRDIKDGTNQIFRYFRSELPIPIINRFVINYLGSRAWKKMEPYVSYDEYLQMKGIADGADVSFGKIKKIHAMPELYPTFCANSAAWGPATKDGGLIALRNLDWNRKMGIQDFAAVKFFKMPGQKSYVNIGYAGFAGVLSGLNEKGISVGQIGATSKDETMKGVPMPFLLKRILSESESVEDAVKIFETSDRTRGYNYLITDAVRKQALAIEATWNHLAVFRDADPAEQSVPYALPMEYTVFRGDPALDPKIRDLQLASKGDPKKPGLEMPAGSAYEIRYRKQGELIQKNFGKIDAQVAQLIAREIAPGSNIQSVIYDFPEFWVANAKDDKKAADTEYIKFSMEEF